MNEEETKTDSTEDIIHQTVPENIERTKLKNILLPPIRKTEKTELAQVFKQIPSASSVMISSSKTAKPFGAKIIKQMPPTTSAPVANNELTSSTLYTNQNITKSCVTKQIPKTHYHGVTGRISIKRTALGTQQSKTAAVLHERVPMTTSTPIKQTMPRSYDLPQASTSLSPTPVSIIDGMSLPVSQPDNASTTAVNVSNMAIVGNATSPQSGNQNGQPEEISMSLIFKKLKVIERIVTNNAKFHIAEKRVLDDISSKISQLNQQIETESTTKLKLPLRNQKQLDDIEEHFERYEQDLRSVFNSFIGHKLFDMYRYFCDQILANADYFNWTGTKAYNAGDDRVPKNASDLHIIRLLLEVGVEKMCVDRETGIREMVRVISAFNSATIARGKRRKV